MNVNFHVTQTFRQMFLSWLGQDLNFHPTGMSTAKWNKCMELEIILKNNKMCESCGGHNYWYHIKFLMVFVTLYTRFHTQPYQIHGRFHNYLELPGYPFSSHITNTRLMASFSGTTWVSQNQKGKTILDFNEARDDGVAVASAGSYANHLLLAPDR